MEVDQIFGFGVIVVMVAVVGSFVVFDIAVAGVVAVAGVFDILNWTARFSFLIFIIPWN